MARTTLRRVATGAALLAASLLLAGCYGVVASKPWFTAANVAGAPKVREGVWRYGPTPEKTPCKVDEAKPVKAWPDCAHALSVAGGRLALLGDTTAKSTAQDRVTFLVGPGDPPIMQVYEHDPPDPPYTFIWLRPDKTDAQGRVTAIHGWRVFCTPPPAKSALYPGLTTTTDGNCLATSIAALRGAAKATETDTPDRFDAHWVRDGSR